MNVEFIGSYIQYISIHWFNMLGLPLRVTGKDLDTEQQQRPASSIRNEEFIPDEAMHMELLHDLMPLVSRVIVDNIKAFDLFKPLVVRHIPHKYSEEMAKKSEEVQYVWKDPMQMLCLFCYLELCRFNFLYGFGIQFFFLMDSTVLYSKYIHFLII